jgi:hypothetical protein
VTNRLPALFIPHGGVPCFFLEPPFNDPWERMAAYLRGLDRSIGTRPKAVLAACRA